MITIPTADLVGLLTDVLPFAYPDEEVPQLWCVRIEWDGKQLHTISTDTLRLGWATWQAGDLREGQEAQDDLFTEWGGADDPWKISLRLSEAQDIAKVFALPKKEARVPLTVDHDPQLRRLTVKRSKDTGHSALTLAAEDAFVEFPDPRQLLDKAAAKTTAVKQISYSPKLLADFAKVRPDGPMTMTFTEGRTAAEGLTRITIGKRFVGAIMPVRIGNEDTADG